MQPDEDRLHAEIARGQTLHGRSDQVQMCFKFVLHCYIFQAMQNSCPFVETCVVQAGHSRQASGDLGHFSDQIANPRLASKT